MLATGSITVRPQDAPRAGTTNAATKVEDQKWNWHMQNTEIVQGDPGFPAQYSGPNSLNRQGEAWRRPEDTFGLAGIASGASRPNRRFLQAGGTDILDGDGALTYGWEKILEAYYDFQICRNVHGTVDYQFITNPAFNRDRGPVSVFAARLHWEF